MAAPDGPTGPDPPTGVGDAILVATLAAALLHPPGPVYVVHALQAAAVAGLLWPAVRRHPLFWLGLAGMQGAYVGLDWAWADNHKYLAAYWSLALAVAAATPGRGRAAANLAATARLLVGLVMGLAAAWKLLTPDTRDGSFFAFTLLTDDRFAGRTAWLCGVDAADLAANRAAVETLLSAPTGEGVVLAGAERVRPLATALTWAAAATEGLLAVLFLAPGCHTAWQAARDGLLLAFLAGTYLVAPVPGFGGLLAVMGAAQTPGPRRRAAFLAALVVLEVFTLAYRYSRAGGGA